MTSLHKVCEYITLREGKQGENIYLQQSFVLSFDTTTWLISGFCGGLKDYVNFL